MQSQQHNNATTHNTIQHTNTNTTHHTNTQHITYIFGYFLLLIGCCWFFLCCLHCLIVCCWLVGVLVSCILFIAFVYLFILFIRKDNTTTQQINIIMMGKLVANEKKIRGKYTCETIAIDEPILKTPSFPTYLLLTGLCPQKNWNLLILHASFSFFFKSFCFFEKLCLGKKGALLARVETLSIGHFFFLAGACKHTFWCWFFLLLYAAWKLGFLYVLWFNKICKIIKHSYTRYHIYIHY